MQFKFTCTHCAALLTVMALAMPAINFAAQSAENPEEVIAIAGDRKITRQDFRRELDDIAEMMKSRGIPAAQFEQMVANIKPQIVEGMVTRALIDQACEDRKIEVTAKDIADKIEAFEKNLPASMTLDNLLEQSGLTRDMFENDLREQLKLEKLLDVSTATDEEVSAYYEENKARFFQKPEMVHARHILIATDPDDNDEQRGEKRAQAEKILEKLEGGADFAELAKAESACPSKSMGGDLGEFRRGQMVPEFEKAAFGLEDDAISGIVETKFGFHIIQTLSQIAAHTVPLDEARGRIVETLKGRQVQEKAEALLDQLRRETEIDYPVKEFDPRAQEES